MAAKFLCCLPLRLGVIVISFIQILVCGGYAGLLWWALWYDKEHANDCKHVPLPPMLVLEQPYSRHNYTIHEDDSYYCGIDIHCCGSAWVGWVN